MAYATRQARIRHDGGVRRRHPVLAANQGLYNGFLAVGLAWSCWRGDMALQLFFLGCVLAAGVFGRLTASRKILWVQALPAAIAILAAWAVR